MSDSNKTYRVKANVGSDSNIVLNLDQDYDVLEILSIKVKSEDTYKLHSANYGVIVGRVQANNGFGVPNAKLSVFIEGDFDADSMKLNAIYPYTSTSTKDGNGVRYNLLTDSQVDDCHQVVGTFPNKTYLLDNDILIEVFDKYYKFTTRTNNSGDYLICGVPVGTHTIHMDLDLSDCGILSQRPRDFVYKGYTIEQFENPNQFKTDTEIDSLSQIFSQDQVVTVIPFWGNEGEGESIGITRADINISFKFEPTCVFIGCVVGDNASNGISKKCVPTNTMGQMDELTTGNGTIEMIRKTPSGEVEEFQIKGTQLINGNGVWCYQIPMNLDYMMTDEYGNMVPTDDPDKGIPTRARVRFRVSMQDFEENMNNYFRAKVLVPHNPHDLPNGGHEDYDYEFGSDTREDSFRDLFWDNVYSVKSYIPRFQQSRSAKNPRFSGIKGCNHYGQNNPMPYNNIRVRLPLMFTILCVLITSYVRIVGFVNYLFDVVGQILYKLGTFGLSKLLKKFLKVAPGMFIFEGLYGWALQMTMTVLDEGLCPDLENWYFAPVNPFRHTTAKSWEVLPNKYKGKYFDLWKQTYDGIMGREINPDIEDDEDFPLEKQTVNTSIDRTSINELNKDEEEISACLTVKTDYLISCIEMNLAEEYRVINFDFYNDWVNGAIYMPRWNRTITPKRTFLFGLIKIKSKIKACMDDSSIFGKTRKYTQQCALSYKVESGKPYTEINASGYIGCKPNSKVQKCHKNNGKKTYNIFGSGRKGKKGNGGIVHSNETSRGQYVYYFKPCEWNIDNGKRTVLFANDLILLGSLKECNQYGIPQAFKYLNSSSYILPTNLALTNMDDEGYLYAGEDGTYCGDNHHDAENNNFEGALKTMDTTFEATQKYWSQSPDDLVQYGNKDSDNVGANYDDMIPITEAAGISWNYTGPGQGKASKKNELPNNLYQPGGHFLGLSCFNSEVNIKSCVNLQRICEAGATMSQRREVVRKINGNDKNDVTMSYQYYIPTGFISYDDINGGDFRTMFSSMNHRRLLCDGNTVDEKTGYPIYDFMYLKSNGFGGEMKKFIDDASNNYNAIVSSDVTNEKEFMLSQGASIADDYDDDEANFSARKTIEATNNDYYKFRMGLETLNDSEQRKRFLKDDSSSVSLPQYENSFYFYFGLKDGATALDEFSKQFFSTCVSRSIVMNDPYIAANVDVNCCTLTGDLELYGNFMVAPIKIRIEDNVTNSVIVADIVDNGRVVSGNVRFDNVISQTEKFPINGKISLPFGDYKITMVDANETTITKIIGVGSDAINMNFYGNNFSFKTSGLTETEISENGKTNKSGYIEINKRFFVDGTEYVLGGRSECDGTTDSVIAIVEDGTENYFVCPDKNINGINSLIGITGSRINASFDETDSSYKVYVWKADANYSIYLLTNCDGWHGVYIGQLRINGIDGINMYLGSKYLLFGITKEYVDMEKDTDKKLADGWAKRHALFRQYDNDSIPFKCNVFAMDEYGRMMPTALFGRPELPNGELSMELGGNTHTCYQYDKYDGDLSDNSIIPTCGSTEVTKGRESFQKNVVYNGNVIFGNLYKTLTPIRCYEEDDYWAMEIDDFGNPSPTGKGFILITEYGDIVYAILDNPRKLRYFGPEIKSGTECYAYASESYDIYYRPFYAEMNYLVWDIADVVLSQEGSSVEYEVKNGTGWRCEATVFNGITYGGVFSDFSINNKGKIISETGEEITIKDEFKRNDSSDIDNMEQYSVWTDDVIPINPSIGVSMYKSINYTTADDSLDNTVSYSIVEGCPENVPEKIKEPFGLSLEIRNGSLKYDFQDNISCIYNDGIYTFIGEPVDTEEYYIINGKKHGINFPFKEEPIYAYYAEKSGNKIKTNKWGLVDTIYVQSRYNTIASEKNKNNDIDDLFFVKIKKSGGKVIITFSIYLDEDAINPIEVTVYSESTPGANEVIDNYLFNTVLSLKGGDVGESDDTIERYLSKCGVDLVRTYEFENPDYKFENQEDDDEGKNKDVKIINECISHINLTNGSTRIGFDGEGYVNFDPENDFVIGIVTGTTGQKGVIRVVKIYPNVTILNNWSTGGLKPMLKFEPVDTVDEYRMFSQTGGDLPWKVKSNVDWKWNFEYEQTGFTNWLSFLDGSFETNITNGYSGSGIATKSYMVRAIDNSGVNGKDGGTLSTVSVVDDNKLNNVLVEKNGKKYYTLYVSGASDTISYDDEKNDLTQLSAYTRFYLEVKNDVSFININNSISDTYTFGSDGGTIDIKVTNNVGPWNVEWSGGGADWISIDPNTPSSGNGNGFVRLIAKNNGGGRKPECALMISPYYGNTENYEYGILKFNMTYNLQKPNIVVVAEYPKP